MVAPEVPGGGSVGQAVLDDEADGQPLNAAGVVAPGQGEVAQVGGKATAAGSAAVSGEGNEQVDRPPSAWVAQIMQGAPVVGVTAGTLTAARAGPGAERAAVAFNTRLGEVFDLGDSLGGVGDVLARAHGTDSSLNKVLLLHYTPPGRLRDTLDASLSIFHWIAILLADTSPRSKPI